MGKIHDVNGRFVDVTDHDAVQALSADDYAELRGQTLRTPADSTDTIVGMQEDQPAAGTGLIILNPPSTASVYAVRFEMTDNFDLQIPARDAGDQAGLLLDRTGEPYCHPSSVNTLGPDNPCHGNGFVASGAKEIIPEYRLPAHTELPDRTEVWRITPSGGEELVGGRWPRF